MFFISWGSKMVRLVFGGPEAHHCDICREERTFRKIVTYKVHHVWWIFRWVSERTYGLICEICRNGHVINTKAAEAAAGKSPIPFMDRLGWTTGLGAIAALSATVAVAGAVDNNRVVAELEHPVVGEILEVDLAKFEKNPQAPYMYSAVQVVRVTPESVDVLMPKSFSNELAGIQEKVTDGSARRPDFYTDEVVSIARGGLKKLHDDGAIIAVEH
jgi:hypothetical protein